MRITSDVKISCMLLKQSNLMTKKTICEGVAMKRFP